LAAGWIVKASGSELDWKNDESRLKSHVLPEFGDLVLAEVRARRVVDLFHKLRTDRERNLAQRTIYSIYTAVSALFRDAKLAALIEQSPCILDERQLRPLVDKDPEWRNEALFVRDEVETIIFDTQIPADRQMVYALELLAGVRPGKPRRCAAGTTIRPCRHSARSWWRNPTTRAEISRRQPRPARSSTFLFIPCWPRRPIGGQRPGRQLARQRSVMSTHTIAPRSDLLQVSQITQFPLATECQAPSRRHRKRRQRYAEHV
jgi:hypothetical protein